VNGLKSIRAREENLMALAADSKFIQIVSRNRITWLLIAGLLFFRFPLIIWSAYDRSIYNWAVPLAEIGTYLFVAILIWWERDRLAESHIDGLALGLLIAKPIEALFYLPGMSPRVFWPYLFYIPISLSLIITLLIYRPTLSRSSAKNWLWLGVGILVGMGMGMGVGYLFAHYQNLGTSFTGGKTIVEILANSSLVRQYMGFMLVNPVQQMFYAGGMEEPLFRGFLWGALRRAGWRDRWICLFQAGLFGLGHIYYLTGGLYWSFGFTLVAGLVFGILAWRSRSIATSMLAHGVTNAWCNIFTFMISWS
jgi:membrane protease YdiL (CAAX protease family)